jgi:hypothetical protein
MGRAVVMTTVDRPDCYLVLACPVLANGKSGEMHILKICSVWDENDRYVEEIITECHGPLDFRDYLSPVPGKIGERVVRPDWAQVAREKTIPNQSERARENMLVYVDWAKKERWDIWASEY